MAEQQTQLISKIVTDETQTPVGERGGGGKEVKGGGGGSSDGEEACNRDGKCFIYSILQVFIKATTTHHSLVDIRQTHRAILSHE